MNLECDDFSGLAMHKFAAELFPICRSLTGNGVRETLAAIRERLPGLVIHEVPSGTQAFDWTVPDEWNIRSARLTGPTGETVVDFKDSNLHVVGYSEPVDVELDLDGLQAHLHSLPEQPEAIPYITSYYKRNWGFCLPHRVREDLKPGRYRAVVDSTLAPGSLTYAELVLPGETAEEVFLSTYICHPSMANNELSGPVVTAALASWLISLPARRYTYRIVFIPETIGSIVYLSRNLDIMKKRMVAGFNVSCVGDDRAYSFVRSRLGDTFADRLAACVFKHHSPEIRHFEYSFLDRGSDERQYCAPGVDLPVVGVSRSKYGCYPEYHTSLDDLTLVTPTGLAGAFDVLRKCIEAIESNRKYLVRCMGEPQLGKRGLYPNLSTKSSGSSVQLMMNMITYCDGNHDLIAIAERLDVPLEKLAPIAKILFEANLIEIANRDQRGV